MQLKERDGIACDHCGATHRNDFEYLSFDFHHIEVIDDRRVPLNHVLKTPVVFSLDICSLCFDSITRIVINNNQKYVSPTRRTVVPLMCDWTGSMLRGNFIYYYCVITKINVVLSGQPNICTKCGTKTYDDDKSCNKCGNTEFTRPAMVVAVDRFLELIICEAAYNHFVDKAKLVRKTAGEWSTQS